MEQIENGQGCGLTMGSAWSALYKYIYEYTHIYARTKSVIEPIVLECFVDKVFSLIHEFTMRNYKVQKNPTGANGPNER